MGECPYDPSPGACELLPDNVLAVHLWQRWQTLGDVVFELLPLALTGSQAALLTEQLYTLTTYSAYLEEHASGDTEGDDGRDDGV